MKSILPPFPVLALLAGSLPLTGCLTVGPDYTPPAPAVPDAWQAAIEQDFKQGQPALAAWWTVFGDDTLNQVMTDASAGNLDLKIAASRIEEARQVLAFSRGERLPAFDATGAALWTRNSEATVPTLGPGMEREDELFQAGATVGWEMDVWGQIRRSIQSADAAYQASIEEHRDVRVLLYGDVGTTYFEVRALQERIRYAAANVELQKETLQLTRDRNTAGLVPELDVRQAELNLAVTSAVIPSLRAALVQAMNRLGVLTGQPPGALHERLRSPRPIALPPDATIVGLPVDLLRQRPDVRFAERALAAQHARIGVAQGELYPTFTLPGTFVLEAPDSDDVVDGDSLTYRFGPSLRWNLFSGNRLRSAVRIEEARTEQLRQIYENTVLAALEEVENAMVALTEERNRNRDLQDAVTAAKASVEQVNTLYRSGLTDFQNVLDTQRALTIQQDSLAASLGLLSQRYAQLYKALGGGWTPEPE